MPIKTYNTQLGANTYILTDNGYKKLYEVYDSNLNVWNGDRFVNCNIIKTKNDVLYNIELSNGFKLECSKYCKFGIITKDGDVELKYVDEIHLDDICISFNKMPIIRNNFYSTFLIDEEEPPINCNLRLQLVWLSNHLDKDAGCMQITSDNKEWLRCIQLMCHCIGTSPFITCSPRGYHLRFESYDARLLLLDLRMPIDKKISDYCFIPRIPISIKSISTSYGLYDTYIII